MAGFVVGNIKLNEIDKAQTLIKSVFDKYIAPGYSPEGIRHFYEFITLEAIISRLITKSFMLAARTENEIIGVAEIRDYSHISLLFTAEAYHGNGVARTLIRTAIDKCLQKNKELKSITVKASPYAVPIYEKLGFSCSEPEQVLNGLRFTPMIRTLK
ncbi:GNAT family N-acetyltransferase [Sporomusa aerivorans]|uniref:GNAT family N-acetyltransferase n=1 Tax=Sporomusa aerivorans TaxID=204936 RepID=UPI00352BAAD7